MSKSIIIGANGYIGRNLAQYLKSKNEIMNCFDIQNISFDRISNYSQLDITDYHRLVEIDLDVDYIYFFAGLTGTTQGFELYEKYIDVNEKGLLNVITRMKESDSHARIIFPSTRLIFKGHMDDLLNENSEKEVKTIYAANKLNCENILAIYNNIFGIQYTIFRICVPYGSLINGPISYGTIGFFLKKAINGQNIQLYGDGLLYRTFTHIYDVCNKIYKSIKFDESNGRIYNIGGEKLSLLDVANQIAQKFSVKVEFVEWPELNLKIESGNTVFDSRQLDNLVKEDYLFHFSQWLSEDTIAFSHE